MVATCMRGEHTEDNSRYTRNRVRKCSIEQNSLELAMACVISATPLHSTSPTTRFVLVFLSQAIPLFQAHSLLVSHAQLVFRYREYLVSVPSLFRDHWASS